MTCLSKERCDMAHGSKVDIPVSPGQSRHEVAMNAEVASERARMRALIAEPVVPLNVELHQRLLRSGGAKASTFASAMASLSRLRKARLDPRQQKGCKHGHELTALSSSRRHHACRYAGPERGPIIPRSGLCSTTPCISSLYGLVLSRVVDCLIFKQTLPPL